MTYSHNNQQSYTQYQQLIHNLLILTRINKIIHSLITKCNILRGLLRDNLIFVVYCQLENECYFGHIIVACVIFGDQDYIFKVWY